MSTHTPSSLWCRSADGPWPRGWWTHVRYRAERDLRQEQQNRSKVLSLRKFCLFFLKRRTCQEKRKRAGVGTNFGQSDQKECRVKGGVSLSARRQILGYESPLLAQGLRKFWWQTRTGHHTERRSWGSRRLWVPLTGRHTHWRSTLSSHPGLRDDFPDAAGYFSNWQLSIELLFSFTLKEENPTTFHRDDYQLPNVNLKRIF